MVSERAAYTRRFMAMTQPPDVSVVMPFRDDEDVVGAACARLIAHLRERGHHPEVLAVDEGSGDNSKALLAVLARHEPSLRVLHARAGRGYLVGAREARGRYLLCVEPSAVDATIAGQGWAHARMSEPRFDVAVMAGRFALLRRTRGVRALDRAHGRGVAYHVRLIKAARRDGLGVAEPVRPARRWFAGGPLRFVSSLLSAL